MNLEKTSSALGQLSHVGRSAALAHLTCAAMNRKEAISWDEQNLAANAEEAENAQKQQIVGKKRSAGEAVLTPRA